MLAEAVALAKTHHAELVLMHVVDGVGGTWYGPQTGDLESRDDEAYLQSLAERLRRNWPGKAFRRSTPCWATATPRPKSSTSPGKRTST